jgi:hypothetical protein
MSSFIVIDIFDNRLLTVIFFDKKYILISRWYQLHPASTTTQYLNGSTDAHNQKQKDDTKKIKDPLRCYSPRSNNTTTTITTPELQALQKRRLREGNSAQAMSSLDQRS